MLVSLTSPTVMAVFLVLYLTEYPDKEARKKSITRDVKGKSNLDIQWYNYEIYLKNILFFSFSGPEKVR